MSAIGYLRKNGIKHTLEVIWQYKIDRLLLRLLRPICLRLPLTDTIVIESHNDFDSNGGAFYDYLIEHGYNERYRIVWQIKNKASKKVPLPKNVICVPLWRPSVRRDRYLLRARYIVTSQNVQGTLRPEQKSYYLTHGPVGLKAFRGKATLPEDLDYVLCPSTYLAPILAYQYMIPYPNDKQIILGYPSHDVLYRPGEGDLHQLTRKSYAKVILWMPTFRTNKTGSRHDSDGELPLGIPLFADMEQYTALNDRLRAVDVLLLIKIHPMQDLSQVLVRSLSNIAVLDGQTVKRMGIDNYRLMKDADALVSDYSSVAYDFLHLNRPVAYTMDDAADYNLGFIVDDPHTLMAGPEIVDLDGLHAFIDDVIAGRDLYRDARAELFDRVFRYHDGGSSRRLAEHMGLVDPDRKGG